MIRSLTKSCALALAVVLTTVVCVPAPALAGDYTYGGSNYGYGNDNQPASSGEMGRSMGGATGMAIGAVGGAALAAVLAKTTAVAAMGPLGVTLVIAGVTATSLLLGSKVFSTLGQSLERSLGTKNFWTMIGATLGAIACIGLLPATGIFAGPAGLLMKGLIGGIAGGTLARLFSNQLNYIATPRILFPAVGGLLAAVGGMGPIGAIGGVVFGYVIGSVMDSVYFADRQRSVSSYVDEAGNKVSNATSGISGWFQGIKDWISGKTNIAKDFVSDNLRDDQYYNSYYDSGYSSAYGSNTYKDPYAVNYNSSYSGQNLSSSYNGYQDAYSEFLRLNNNGASIEDRRQALDNLRRQSESYGNARNSAYGVSGSYNYGSFDYGY